MWIAKGMSCCVIGENTIVLDIDQDRYFALDKQLSAAFRDCVDRNAIPSAGTCRDLERLQKLGLLSLLDYRRDFPNPTTEYDGPPATPINYLHIPEVLFRKAMTARIVKHQAFAQNIHQLRQLKLSTKVGLQVDLSRACGLLSAFRAARHLFSDNDRCLGLSIAAFQALLSRNIDVELVVGVTLPFAAHCWVQHRTTVLTDSLDVVSRYEPILVV